MAGTRIEVRPGGVVTVAGKVRAAAVEATAGKVTPLPDTFGARPAGAREVRCA